MKGGRVTRPLPSVHLCSASSFDSKDASHHQKQCPKTQVELSPMWVIRDLLSIFIYRFCSTHNVQLRWDDSLISFMLLRLTTLMERLSSHIQLNNQSQRCLQSNPFLARVGQKEVVMSKGPFLNFTRCSPFRYIYFFCKQYIKIYI